MKARASLYINTHKTNSEKKHPVSVKIVFGKRKYYPLGINLTSDEFLKKRNNRDIAYINKRYADAIVIIDDLGDNFSFALFDAAFMKNKPRGETIRELISEVIEELEDDRIGSKQAYGCALQSFEQFRPKTMLRDVDAKWLKAYERWMDRKGNSKTTIGFYLRALRAVMNKAIAEGVMMRDLYPFGRGKYEIPTSKKSKKALTLSEIKKIIEYPVQQGPEEMCRDYWLFIYLCNGLNVSDLCRLRRTDFEQDKIRFVREKTKRTKREVEAIEIRLLPKAKEILVKYSGKQGDYLFPHFRSDMSFEQQDKTVYNLTKMINGYMKRIAAKADIDKPVTTYAARHSFATVLKNKGTPVAMISQMLGHSSIQTTENYLASFETDQIKKATEGLLDFG